MQFVEPNYQQFKDFNTGIVIESPRLAAIKWLIGKDLLGFNGDLKIKSKEKVGSFRIESRQFLHTYVITYQCSVTTFIVSKANRPYFVRQLEFTSLNSNDISTFSIFQISEKELFTLILHLWLLEVKYTFRNSHLYFLSSWILLKSWFQTFSKIWIDSDRRATMRFFAISQFLPQKFRDLNFFPWNPKIKSKICRKSQSLLLFDILSIL